jgi:hypothetical protein
VAVDVHNVLGTTYARNAPQSGALRRDGGLVASRLRPGLALTPSSRGCNQPGRRSPRS